MKAWMKVLVWLGLGGGIGFFAGYQIGLERGNRRVDEIQMNEWAAYEGGYNQALRDNGVIKTSETWEDARTALEKYRGETGSPPDEEAAVDIQPETEDDETLWSFTPSEDPEMPEEPPVIGDEAEIEDIPELHPQHMTQRQVTEEYFYNNPNNFDQEDLLYYEGDGTLYNKDTRKAIDKKDEIDEVLGIGMLTNFHMKGADLETIFVENPTMGMLFRIDRVEDAFGDILNGVVAEEIDEEDDTE